MSADSCSARFASAAALSSRQLRLELGQLGASRLQLPLLVARDLARVGQHAAALAERLAPGLELLADRADLVGEGRVLVRDGDQVAELGGDLVERVGREDDLEQRRLAALVGIAKVVLEQVLALGELGGAPVDRRRHVQELGGERVDLVVQVDEVLLDLGDLLLDLDEQAADAVVLGGDGGELGASQVELRRRARLERCSRSASSDRWRWRVADSACCAVLASASCARVCWSSACGSAARAEPPG